MPHQVGLRSQGMEGQHLWTTIHQVRITSAASLLCILDRRNGHARLLSYKRHLPSPSVLARGTTALEVEVDGVDFDFGQPVLHECDPVRCSRNRI